MREILYGNIVLFTKLCYAGLGLEFLLPHFLRLHHFRVANVEEIRNILTRDDFSERYTRKNTKLKTNI